MVKIRALAIGWHSDDFPGWIEVSIRDASGTNHRVVEKVPVVTSSKVTSDSSFPLEIWIAGDAELGDQDQVVVTLLDGVETTNGADRLAMKREDVDVY